MTDGEMVSTLRATSQTYVSPLFVELMCRLLERASQQWPTAATPVSLADSQEQVR